MVSVSNEQVEIANKRGDERRKSPTVIKARYDRRIRRIVLRLTTGYDITFSPRNVEGLESADPDDIGKIEISPSGLGITFPLIDVDLYLPALLEGVMGSERWMASHIGSRGGRSTSAAKAAASRANGARGGRPKQVGAALVAPKV